MKTKHVFWNGFFLGWCAGLIALALLLAVGGCKIEQPASNAEQADSLQVVTPPDSAIALPDTVINGKLWHRYQAGHWRDVVLWRYIPPREPLANADTVRAAAKVAAVMQVNDITLPQVASYLNTYGFDVIQRSEFRRWHWSPPTSGAPVAYYVVNFRVAVGDTTLPIYIPQGATACPYWIRVKGFTGQGVEGPWSHSNVSGAGALLPGVAE